MSGVTEESGCIVDDEARTREQGRTVSRQDGPFSCAFDQLKAQVTFESAQPLRNRWLCHSQCTGGSTEVAVLCNRDEVAKVTDQVHDSQSTRSLGTPLSDPRPRCF